MGSGESVGWKVQVAVVETSLAEALEKLVTVEKRVTILNANVQKARLKSASAKKNVLCVAGGDSGWASCAAVGTDACVGAGESS